MTATGRNKAVFFDRDGTLLVEMGYINHPSLVAPYRFTVEALRRARESGFLLIAVTNQSGVGRGYISEAELGNIHARFQDILSKNGVPLDAIYYCPHHPEARLARYRKRCGCRKPAPAMGLEAAERFGIDLGVSYMIGDKETDVLFGRNLGVIPCMVRTGYGSYEEGVMKEVPGGDVDTFDDVLAAVKWITGGE
jgi:D-glycero-D-manno-heptose 1,7-bisphosphate phosphatase